MKVICLIAFALTVASGCSGSATSGPAPPPPPPPVVGPTSVVLTQASVVLVEGFTDRVTVGVRNDGGTGDFYIEFWGEPVPTAPSGCKVEPGQTGPCPHPAQSQIGVAQGANVTLGYAQILAYLIDGTVSSVKVKSRPMNTPIYALTACAKVRDFGTCP